MKSIPFLLIVLLIIGCSSNWSTNSTDQESEATETALLLTNDAGDTPVTEIEPDTPLCETEHFGYVEFINTSRVSVRAVIGDEISIIVRPNIPYRVQVSMGIREVQWWPSDNSHYVCTAYVPMCKTVVNKFDPLQACHSLQDQ